MSKRHSIACDIWVPAPVDQVWTFCSQPKNLAAISPEFLHLSVSAPDSPQEADLVHITLNPGGFGATIKWDSRISCVQNNGSTRAFVDTQEKGPFMYWRHEHVFESGAIEIEGSRSKSFLRAKNPGTWIKDRVEYDIAPFGIGKLINNLVIENELAKMFAHRSASLREIFA
jgi:ligand-binding SRPBCC domain-containing protein